MGVASWQWRDSWKRKIVEEAADHFRGRGGDHVLHQVELEKLSVMEGKGRNAATTRRIAAQDQLARPSMPSQHVIQDSTTSLLEILF